MCQNIKKNVGVFKNSLTWHGSDNQITIVLLANNQSMIYDLLMVSDFRSLRQHHPRDHDVTKFQE